jgi:hypothetical protein
VKILRPELTAGVWCRSFRTRDRHRRQSAASAHSPTL